MFSSACQYAIRAVLFLAVHASDEHKVGVDELTQGLGVPRHFLAKILQDLAKHKLISSKKGPGGGFYLSAKNLQSPLTSIVEAIDGPDIFRRCVLGFETCGSANPCPLHMQAFAFREGLRYQMASYTIEDMAHRIQREGVKI